METGLAKYVSDGFEIAKKGDAVNIYNNVLPYLANGQLPEKSHYAFGWIIYYALHQTPDTEIAERKRMLANYLTLNVPTPHKLHSMILTEAIRLYKDAKRSAFGKKAELVPKFSIVKFTELWGLSNLRPGDWRRKEHEGKELPSTVEKLITVYVDEAEETKSVPAEGFMKVIDEALSQNPDSYGLLAQRAILHSMAGEKDAARSLLRKALLSASTKAFLWRRMATLVSLEENPRLYMGLLYKALICPEPENMKGKIRMALAEALVEKGQYGNALWELNHVKQTYERNSWHLPKGLEQALSKIPEGTTASDPTALYKKLEPYADNEVYESLPVINVTKTYHKNPDPSKNKYGRPVVAWRVTDSEGNNYWLQPHRFNIPANLPTGTVLSIRVYDGRPVKAWL